VDTRTLLARLIAPLGVGDELAGHRVIEVSEAHGMRLVLARGETRVFLDVDALDASFAFAAATDRLAISYRGASPSRPIAGHDGRALAKALAAVISVNEAQVLDALADGARSARTSHEGTARIREVHVAHALEPGGEGEARFDTVSPYVGCLVGCTFCYAQERLHRTRALFSLPALPWGSWVDARVNVADVLRDELARARDPRPIKLSPIVSDPYHAIERRFRLTRAVIEAIRDDDRRDALVLTRSAIVREDLTQLLDARAHLGFSIPTVREEIRASLEPRSATIEERLAVLSEARALGIRTFAMIQPVLDRDVLPLADAIARTCDSAQLDVLRGTYGASTLFESAALADLARADVQAELVASLKDALRSRGVRVWDGELPPDLVHPPRA
jgi:DNA repair photolyase